jgi:hypothetical protein
MMCLEAVLVSSACVRDMSTCTYVRTVLTKNYSPLVSVVTERLAHRGAER